MSLTHDQRRIRLLRKQAGMRFRQSGTRKGWPLGKKRNKPEISLSQVKFALSLCLQRGLSPEVSAKLVREKFGARVVDSAVRMWRDSAMLDDKPLRRSGMGE